MIQFDSGNSHLEIRRSQKSLFYVFESIGGVSRGISIDAVMVYFFYNHYCYIKYLILWTIVEKEDYYNERFKLRKQYLQIYLYTSPFCCCCKEIKMENWAKIQVLKIKWKVRAPVKKLLNNRLCMENFYH
jgi:hypothetical protein